VQSIKLFDFDFDGASGCTLRILNIIEVAFGKGFDARNLRNMRQFYIAFPIQEAVSPLRYYLFMLELHKNFAKYTIL